MDTYSDSALVSHDSLGRLFLDFITRFNFRPDNNQSVHQLHHNYTE